MTKNKEKLTELLVKSTPPEYEYAVSLESIGDALNYLEHYGYIDDIETAKVDEVEKVTEDFQRLAGLKEDGVIGPKTLQAMKWPRCACPDVVKNRTEEAKWARKHFKYYIERRDSDLSSDEWADAMKKAFQQWADVADVTFERTDSKEDAQFVISVGSGRRDGFDGPQGTLAWAMLPVGNNYDGQSLTKFDTAETWVLDPSDRGILLVNVACHEFGHLLGLDHSRVNSALMAPFYNPNVTKPQEPDDISRLQRLYGKPQEPTDPVDPDPTDPTDPTDPVDPDPTDPTDPVDPDPTDPTDPPEDDSIEIRLTISSGVKGIKIPGYTVEKDK